MQNSFEINKKIGRGINLGNALEAPNEGDWEIIVKPEYFQIIKAAGFSSVRVPIRWSSHTLNKAPFTINEKFFSRIDLIIQQALNENLIVIINIHHFNELYINPKKHEEKLNSMWKQISERYSNFSENLLFEILNEPRYSLTSKKWNRIFPNIVEIIRKQNPERIILIGPARWNNIEGFRKLNLPKNLKNIIITFHYYKPFTFTHQGAEWIWLSNLFLWRKIYSQNRLTKKTDVHFNKVYNFGKKHNIPINLGEFGTYHKADFNSRILWTTLVARTAEKYNFSWIYWEFGAGFGIYDINKKMWKKDLFKALVP
jgi:endoglucanase